MKLIYKTQNYQKGLDHKELLPLASYENTTEWLTIINIKVFYKKFF